MTSTRTLVIALAGCAMVVAACGGGGHGTAGERPGRAPAANVSGTTSAAGSATSTAPAGRAPIRTANRATATTTTAPASTTVAHTTTTATRPSGTGSGRSTCNADDDQLARTLAAYAKSQQPASPMIVAHLAHATADPAWARADIVSAIAGAPVEGFVVIARCVGVQWVVVDAGTTDVGCPPVVPAAVSRQIGVDC